MELAGSHTVVGKVILEPFGGPGVPCAENPGAVRPPTPGNVDSLVDEIEKRFTTLEDRWESRSKD